MSPSPRFSRELPCWERPGLVRLAAGGDSEKATTPSEFNSNFGPAS